MELLRPKSYKTESKVILTNGQDFEYVDPTYGVKFIKSINILTIGNFGYNQPSINFDMSPLDNNKLALFAGMQALIKSCVDNAEEIKNSLHQKYINISKPQTEEEKKEVMKIDFMKLRDWYMDDIRSSKIYQQFSVYNSTKKLKPFSKMFTSFVEDRNIYTHGQLCLVKPDYDFLIDYIDGVRGNKYVSINLEILKSYNSAYNVIRNVIREYDVIHQNRLLAN